MGTDPLCLARACRLHAADEHRNDFHARLTHARAGRPKPDKGQCKIMVQLCLLGEPSRSCNSTSIATMRRKPNNKLASVTY